MSQKRQTVDQIIAKLRRADVVLGKGTNAPELCKQLEIADQAYYRRRQKVGACNRRWPRNLKLCRKRTLG